MDRSASISLWDEKFDFPVMEGTEGEMAVDLRALRKKSGYIVFDEGYGNTASCFSNITFVDGENGVLRYRGYPIEQLAESSSFLEATYLLIYGELPTEDEFSEFRGRILHNANVHVAMKQHYEGFPPDSSPMAILASMLNALGCYYPDMASNNRQQDLATFDGASSIVISKVRTIASMTYRMARGLPYNYPRHDLDYCGNLLHMMFSEPHNPYEIKDEVARALDLFLLLHADHEQNCSTSTVRMVASGGANLFASLSSGVSALWGPLHGGANMAVIAMLEEILSGGISAHEVIEEAKSGKRRLMGFGHRVYKNFDPRASILSEAADRVLRALGYRDPLLDLAQSLAEAARSDEYFIERNLYPNVDFYSGIILKAIGVPPDMFTVMFAIGRLPGWIAHWKELAENPNGHIHRPRQIYLGENARDYVAMKNRSAAVN